MTSLGSSPQATGIAAARPAQDGVVPAAVADATGGGDWAICCSGGGIRSAACCLGALQSLDSDGLLGIAKWIVGVSGGSYIASSRALVAHDLPPGTVPHAYAPGTAEQRNLRDNTRYIAPNGATVLVPAGAHGLPEQGDIWVCQLGWWSGAPWDVLAYAKDHSTCPCDSTLEQLYDAAGFEAYHELGEATVLAAAKECKPPLRCPAPAGHGSPPVLHQLGNAAGA